MTHALYGNLTATFYPIAAFGVVFHHVTSRHNITLIASHLGGVFETLETFNFHCSIQTAPKPRQLKMLKVGGGSWHRTKKESIKLPGWYKQQVKQSKTNTKTRTPSIYQLAIKNKSIMFQNIHTRVKVNCMKVPCIGLYKPCLHLPVGNSAMLLWPLGMW